MEMNKNEIYTLIDEIAPSFLMEDWDNGGIQVNTKNSKVNTILIALEITGPVIDEAIGINADMIVTHHPLLFDAVKQINFDNKAGEYLLKLIENDISVYSAHTSFDKSRGGNNDFLIDLINLDNSLEVGTGPFENLGIGRIFSLKKQVKIEGMVSIISKSLDIPLCEIKYVGDKSINISKVAVCTGSGADLIEEAAKQGCQLLITGDLKYHNAQLAKELGISVIDAGHYHTEKTFTPNFANKLRVLTNDEINVVESQIDINPFEYLNNL